MHRQDFFDARILVVDDEADKIRLVTALLQLAGFTSIHAQEDSAVARATFEEMRPDLLLLDLHMAPYDGFDVLAQIQPLIPDKEFLPVLMLTGDISREVKERALAAGAMDFLAKPFNATEIVLRVKNLLDTRRLHLELQSERALLEQRVQERTAELVEARNEILERLAHVAEYRDDATGAHTQRVAVMVRQIARTMGVPEEEADLMGRAALLHDLGKVGVPDEILLKPGRLTESERETMKRHAKIGADILHGSRSILLQRAEQIARYHHERWNGAGYEGIAGDLVPLAARITAVADVYDALTTQRPYKEAWNRDAAIAEIERLSGTHFDPDVVVAFLKSFAVDAGESELERAA